MKIYLDTSSLIKLYHKEEGTNELESVFASNKITHVYLSEIAKVEVSAAVWKKVRTQEISTEQANTTLHLFEKDFEKFCFITIDSLLLEQARLLVSKYGAEGLRTLDSIQLASCLQLSEDVDLFMSADKLLASLMVFEGLKTK
jgi:predicted nucleic acid-binding protein